MLISKTPHTENETMSFFYTKFSFFFFLLFDV
jgi:hypothetical protein